MKIDCGIIGLPNVGKSTLFEFLTDVSVKIANFPFCTIHPNIAILHIPDKRLYQLNKIIKPYQLVHDIIEFVDCAGLIADASHGEGLGNVIFNHIRTVKILLHVVRFFEDQQITHIFNNVNPGRDINIINTELILFDTLQCEKLIFSLQKNRKINNMSVQELQLSILKKCLVNLNNNIFLNEVLFSKTEIMIVKKFNFLTFKPMIYMANLNENNEINFNKNELNINTMIKQKNTLIIPYYPQILLEKFINMKINYHLKEDFNIQRQKLIDIIINNIFSSLKLQTFFTINLKMVKAWVNVAGITALEAANRVHSDFKRGFIRVQVIKFDDFIYYKGEMEAKKAGKIRFEGKNYQIEEGDILKFFFRK